MKNSDKNQVIGIPFRLATEEAALCEPIVSYTQPRHYCAAQQKRRRADSIIGLLHMYRRKADNLAHGIKDHVSMGPVVTENVKGKLKLGSRIIQAGGIERVFKKSFLTEEGERLIKASLCHLSTTAGPISGLLFISTKKIAFLSDRTLVFQSSQGNVARFPYKVSVPLKMIKGIIPTENANNPDQKYIQIETIDGFEFWFMGFVCYQRSYKNLQQSISESGAFCSKVMKICIGHM